MEIKAKEGYVFVRSNMSEVLSNTIHLGKEDYIYNYIEMPVEEATKLQEELNALAEAKLQEELLNEEDEDVI